MQAKKPMSEPEIRRLASFQELTPKQQKLILEYASNGRDKVAAVLSAYDFKNRESARIGSYACFENRKIVRVLNEIFRVSPKEQFVAELDEAIRNSHLTMAQVEALAAKGRVLRLLPAKYQVGIG